MRSTYTHKHLLISVCRLIKRLLVREPKRRARITDIMSDPWLRSKLQGSSPEELEMGLARLGATPLVRTQKLTGDESEVIVGTMLEGGIAASREEIEASLASDGYDHLAATYYLLAEKLLRDQRSRATGSGAPTPSLERAHGPNSTGVEQGSLRPAAGQTSASNKTSTDQNANFTARPPAEQSDSEQNFAQHRRCSLIREESTDEEPSPSRVNSSIISKNKLRSASKLQMRESSLSISKEAADILANARGARDSLQLQQQQSQDGSPESAASCDASPIHHKQVNLNVDLNIGEGALDALVSSHNCAVDAILEEGSSQEEVNDSPPATQSASVTPGDDQVFVVQTAADENTCPTCASSAPVDDIQMVQNNGYKSTRAASAPMQPQRKLATATSSGVRHRSSAQSPSATLNLNLNVNLEAGGRGSMTPNSVSARPIALLKPRSHSLTRSPRTSSSGAGAGAQHQHQHRSNSKTESAGSALPAGGVVGSGMNGAKQTRSEVLVVDSAGEPIHMHRSRSEGGVLLTAVGHAAPRDASCPACGHTIFSAGGHQISIGLSIRAHTPTRDEFLARSATTPCAFPNLRPSASPNLNASRTGAGAEKEQLQRPIVRAHALRLSLPASHGPPLLRPPTQAAAAEVLSRSASSSAFSCKSDSGVRYERSGATSPALTPTSHITVIKPYEGTLTLTHSSNSHSYSNSYSYSSHTRTLIIHINIVLVPLMRTAGMCLQVAAVQFTSKHYYPYHKHHL